MTVSTMTPDPAPPTGEERERRHRRRFWRLLALCGVVTMPLAVFAGLSEGMWHSGVNLHVPGPLLWLGVTLTLLLYLALVWRFFRSIDELELADNLWSSTVGFYFYVTVFPAWWVLARFGGAPPVEHWAIYFASIAAGALAYGWRKLRAR